MNVAFSRNGVKTAEYPEEAIPALLLSGVILPADSFWHAGMKDWEVVASRWSAGTAVKSPLVDSPPPVLSQKYTQMLQMLTSEGWVVVTEGASGAQIKRPRMMRGSTKFILVIGILGLAVFGLGIILIILALVDFYVLTKEETYFLKKDGPSLPQVADQGFSIFTKILIAVFLGIFLLGLLATIVTRHP